jgi:hypothetical protein
LVSAELERKAADAEEQSAKEPEPRATEFLGLVHHSHAAESLDDAVVRDSLVDHWREYVPKTGKSMKAVPLEVAHEDLLVTAWSAGADFVKLFPCGPVGGDRYIKALHAALPQVPLIAAGGVNQQTAASFILSGATAIGVGTELVPTEAIQRRQSQRIHELARRFAKLVRDAREQIETGRCSQVVKEFTGTEKCEK